MRRAYIMCQLIIHGADPYLRNKAGQTPIDLSGEPFDVNDLEFRSSKLRKIFVEQPIFS